MYDYSSTSVPSPRTTAYGGSSSQLVPIAVDIIITNVT
jgi:hypothetical protein